VVFRGNTAGGWTISLDSEGIPATARRRRIVGRGLTASAQALNRARQGPSREHTYRGDPRSVAWEGGRVTLSVARGWVCAVRQRHHSKMTAHATPKPAPDLEHPKSSESGQAATDGRQAHARNPSQPEGREAARVREHAPALPAN